MGPGPIQGLSADAPNGPSFKGSAITASKPFSAPTKALWAPFISWSWDLQEQVGEVQPELFTGGLSLWATLEQHPLVATSTRGRGALAMQEVGSQLSAWFALAPLAS